MFAKWSYIIILICLIGCQQQALSDQNSVPTENISPRQEQLSTPLRIYKSTLLEGTDMQIRKDTAKEMLFSQDPKAREILLEVLKQKENPAARLIVCETLRQTVTQRQLLNDKDEFMQPLLEMLNEDDAAAAKLAAEALLIFEYDQLAEKLTDMASNPSIPVKTRLNAIYALRIQPDVRAIVQLSKLLEDPQPQVSAEAKKALESLGISVGKTSEARKKTVETLERKNKDEFVREMLIQKENRIQYLQADRDSWLLLYLAALDKIYDNINDDAAKGKFLAEKLTDPKTKIKLWALEKLRQSRVGTASKAPVNELNPVILELISNPDRDIRLKTANLLSLMQEINSAEKLLEQIKAEEDPEVKTEQLTALGGACYYAFLPKSPIKISPDIKKQTLELAKNYLAQEDPQKALTGAKVLQKLLEHDGIDDKDAQGYLMALVNRYRDEEKVNGLLREKLLSIMAELCAQSAYKNFAADYFRPLFEQALTIEADLVREAGVNGLINIDEAKALETFRKNLIYDQNPEITKKIIELAGKVGNQQDLNWLAEKIGNNAESLVAWQNLLAILERCETPVIIDWINRVDSLEQKEKIAAEQMIAFYELTLRKVDNTNQTALIKQVREKLADLYHQTGDYKKSAEYWGMLLEKAENANEKDRMQAELLKVYFDTGEIKKAEFILTNRLLTDDLDPNSYVASVVDNFVGDLPNFVDANSVAAALTNISVPQNRPVWHERVKIWVKQCRQHNHTETEPNQVKK